MSSRSLLTEDELMVYRGWGFDPLIDGEELAEIVMERINEERRRTENKKIIETGYAEKTEEIGEGSEEETAKTE